MSFPNPFRTFAGRRAERRKEQRRRALMLGMMRDLHEMAGTEWWKTVGSKGEVTRCPNSSTSSAGPTPSYPAP